MIERSETCTKSTSKSSIISQILDFTYWTVFVGMNVKTSNLNLNTKTQILRLLPVLLLLLEIASQATSSRNPSLSRVTAACLVQVWTRCQRTSLHSSAILTGFPKRNKKQQFSSKVNKYSTSRQNVVRCAYIPSFNL